MSKIDFKALVEAFILEAPQPTPPPGGQPRRRAPRTPRPGRQASSVWFDELLKEHNQQFGTNYKRTDQIIKDCLSVVSTKKDPYYSRDVIKRLLPVIHILDVLAALRKQLPQAPTSPTDFETKVSNLSNLNIKTYTAQPWDVRDPDVNKAYNAVLFDVEKTAQVALETYKDESIYECVSQIIKRRTDTFSRLMTLRNPFGTPFQSLIKDVLINPEPYTSGNKKVTSDFKNIVDDLYFSSLISVGIAAKAFYATVAQPGQEKNMTEYNKMLNDKQNYNIGELLTLQTPEAVELVAALRSIAQYTREKVGRGERLKYAGQAMSALAGIGGAKLYG